MVSRKGEEPRRPEPPPPPHVPSSPVPSTSQLPDVDPEFRDDVSDVTSVPGVTEGLPAPQAPAELAALKPESERALRRLARYKAPRDNWPMRRRAAVLVALFGGRHGDLYVVLSKRSKKLRSYTGIVAFKTYAEAFEEIGLPINTETVRYLCSLRPFLTRTRLLVTPIVVYILDPSLEPEVNPDEVDSVFSHPLESFLYQIPREPILHALREEVQQGRRPYHMSWDLPWLHGKPYRWHRFESKKHPIIGFTSDILIEAAEIAYGKAEFARRAPGQLPRKRILEIAIEEDPIFQRQPDAEDQPDDVAGAPDAPKAKM